MGRVYIRISLLQWSLRSMFFSGDYYRRAMKKIEANHSRPSARGPHRTIAGAVGWWDTFSRTSAALLRLRRLFSRPAAPRSRRAAEPVFVHYFEYVQTATLKSNGLCPYPASVPSMKSRRAGVLLVLAAGELLFLFNVLSPHLWLRIGDPRQPSNLLSSPAILSNSGLLPIYDITISCTGPGTILETDGKRIFPARSHLHGITLVKRLSRGQSVVASDICEIPDIDHPTHVEAVLRIAFKPLLLPIGHSEIRVVSVGKGLRATQS